VSAAEDRAARTAALDPTRSFIVQAPAGSGKTELLIQRFLALLATVDEPEQVVAITFTRKAAAEMRGRVRSALEKAAAGEEGETPHQEATLVLARAAIERDEQRGWGLLAQPQRLRIDTLDAFNAWLAQQLPVLADGVAAATIVDHADDYYRRAARNTVATVASAGEPGDSVRVLASVFDDLAQLEKLLAKLLARREQWLERFAVADAAALRPLLEGALRRLADDELGALAPLTDPAVFGDLRASLRQVAAHATAPKLLAATAPWLAVDAAPPLEHGALREWQGAASFLLTGDGNWRRRLSKTEGFAKGHAAARERCERLLAHLNGDQDLVAALRAVQKLPEPRYTDAQWRQLEALRVVLLHLAIELKVEFAEARCIDFVELGLAARRALGRVDAPSELLLALDRRIQHLLVDEFQDTSQSQVRLLELLTAGWERGDGRTLFLVGDPMQSIYRFRDADLSLFLEAQLRGVGDVRLQPLALTRNFRSAPEIVSWVNDTFTHVFPKVDQIAAGAAAFRESVATRTATGGQAVYLHGLLSAEPRDESARVAELIAAELERDSEQSIAVLVQARGHVVGLREQLRARGLRVHAVEIDALGEQPVAQDLIGLARALSHRDDRIAWLALLRAPWCGLTWPDLHALCQDARRRAVWDLMREPGRLGRLSADGRSRLEATRARLDAAFAARPGSSFASWVERTWRALDGPACLDREDEVGTAELVFALLARQERLGDLDDPARLEEALAAQQPQGDPPRGRGIEIMTMHRAKGLEFDTVIALGLGRDPPPDDKQPLHWLERAAADGSKDLLLAPTLADEDSERLTDFVRRADRERGRAERARLLYVATTRACDRLHLVWQLAPSGPDPEPKPGSLLSWLWDTLDPAVRIGNANDAAAATGEQEVLEPVLRRLVDVAMPRATEPAQRQAATLSPARGSRARGPARGVPQLALPFETEQEPSTDAAAPAAEPARPEFIWASRTAAHVGTVVHRHLQRIADAGVDSESAASIEARAPAYAQELRLLGVEDGEVGAAAARVVAALCSALEDRHGRFVLGAHDEARSELTLTLRNGDALEHVRLDRTFVADGERWIVDFKTSRHEGGDREAFLDSEMERYRPQLDRYAAALAAIERRVVRVALYFPLLKELRSWSAG
jgi:ATP-dependent exoDNAse (exonuclease V) beta subunit